MRSVQKRLVWTRPMAGGADEGLVFDLFCIYI